MQLIHGSGYTNEEREAFKEIIFSNTVQSMRVIMDAMDTLNIALEKPDNQKHREVIMSLPSQIEADTFPADAAAAVKALWADTGVKECVKRSREYQLNDSAR
jgi:guanine nucleotide-binding protein subunit alpha